MGKEIELLVNHCIKNILKYRKIFFNIIKVDYLIHVFFESGPRKDRPISSKGWDQELKSKRFCDLQNIVFGISADLFFK